MYSCRGWYFIFSSALPVEVSIIWFRPISIECCPPFCGNLNCGQNSSVWRNQPNIDGTKLQPKKFLLSSAILLAGASIPKVQRAFTNMGMACIKRWVGTTHFSLPYWIGTMKKVFELKLLHWSILIPNENEMISCVLSYLKTCALWKVL